MNRRQTSRTESAAIGLLFRYRCCGWYPGEPGGIRTHDPRIKSPLLFQLSYRPGQVQSASDGGLWTRFANELLTAASSATGLTSFAGAENLVQSPREGRLRVGDHMRIDVQRRDRAGVTKTLTDQVDRDSVR